MIHPAWLQNGPKKTPQIVKNDNPPLARSGTKIWQLWIRWHVLARFGTKRGNLFFFSKILWFWKKIDVFAMESKVFDACTTWCCWSCQASWLFWMIQMRFKTRTTKWHHVTSVSTSNSLMIASKWSASQFSPQKLKDQASNYALKTTIIRITLSVISVGHVLVGDNNAGEVFQGGFVIPGNLQCLEQAPMGSVWHPMTKIHHTFLRIIYRVLQGLQSQRLFAWGYI